MKLRDITPERFVQECMLNQYMRPMYMPEPFFTYTSVRALHTTWLYRKRTVYQGVTSTGSTTVSKRI